MWFYIEDGQQRGPVTEADFEALARSGKINSETPVWREGMANWQTLREVKPEFARPAAGMGAPPSLGATPGIGDVVCSQCGGIFPASEVIRYGNAAVCAACKPIFVQRLKEGGVVAGGPVEYAAFWTRFGAYFVDGVITTILSAILGAILGATIGVAARNAGASVLLAPLLAMAGGFVIRGAYFIYFIGNSGQTPGKKMCRIRVINADGSQVSYGKATGRFFGYFLSSFILCIGFLMAAWDDEKRALHDRLCDTRVVKV
jgi:uncharacterized RDD family membrane protein YckC